MARKHKGATVYLDQGVKSQLKQLYENMELSFNEVKDVMQEVVQESADTIQDEINAVLDKHDLTGETRRHAITPVAEWQQVGSSLFVKADVGIKLSGNMQDMKEGNGGYASLLLDYGTPKKRVQKNKKRKYKKALSEPVRPKVITASIRRGRKKAESQVQDAYEKALMRRLDK